jgi:dephospho-CoA kinase
MSDFLYIAAGTVITSYLLTHLFGWKFTGLTGGIATGKSTTTKYLRAKYKANIIDFDQIAREVVHVGSPLLTDLENHFGRAVINELDKTLNREALGNIIFTDPKKRSLLNQLYAGPILQLFLLKSLKLFLTGAGEIILDVPLLFEGKFHNFCRETVLISTEPALQLQRLMQRDKISEEKALHKISAQWSIERKKKLASYVIENTGNETELQAKIDDWMRKHRSSSNLYNLLIPSLPAVTVSVILGIFATIGYVVHMAYHAKINYTNP